jgi:hypothetical protein
MPANRASVSYVRGVQIARLFRMSRLVMCCTGVEVESQRGIGRTLQLS